MRVKICGVCRPEDAELAVSAGATHIGMIRVPGSPRTQPERIVAEVSRFAEGAVRVGVFVDADAAIIRGEADRLRLDVVQLHGSEPPSLIEALRRTGIEVWKTVKPASAGALRRDVARYAAADMILVEGSSDRGHGGVGARFDWDALEPALGDWAHGRPPGVGGGLTPENVDVAVRRFRPGLVDVSSGVESELCRKDEERVREFITAARRASLEAGPHGTEG